MKVRWQVIFVLARPDLAALARSCLPVKLRTVSQGRRDETGVDDPIVIIKFRYWTAVISGADEPIDAVFPIGALPITQRTLIVHNLRH